MKNSVSFYWKCQLIGWSGASLYWFVQGSSGDGFSWSAGLLHFLADIALYILITHLYRTFARNNNWQNSPLNLLFKRLLLALPIMAIAYTGVTVTKIYLIRLVFAQGTNVEILEFIRQNLPGILMAGFRLMAIWMLAYHLYQYSRREIRLVKENASLQLRYREAQLDKLSDQLNPHFLFNSLNTIKSLISTDTKLARRGIDLLSELLRSSLYRQASLTHTLAEELELAKDYLELEKMRMEERLTFSVHADQSLNNFPVLGLSIQTLAENALKHGVSKLKDGGHIAINISRETGFLEIMVTNPGIINEDPDHIGIGLKNLKERLRLAYHGQATFKLFKKNDDLIYSVIRIPLP
ncbi:hypothetical protein N180_03210 [Pedobacter antarcticus 4BY]|uniref:Signal transduction histidine kinase internal region domain-containing protein n=2 Tax=Pedobacter antarcticus TaxID=34086 RepID=A0A081PKP7_9SPHI|nr:histidine kinase [Pedobacter antarcticus]KEQ31270.1 hypothetical protein N180_03210 [Pedobacter antarcticus 4BY]SFE57003.1 Histidine kinase [Pedobacter antarcticus]